MFSDLHKFNEWKTLIADDQQQEWLESDTGSESEGESSSNDSDENTDSDMKTS